MFLARNRGVFVVECWGNAQHRLADEDRYRQWISWLCLGMVAAVLLLCSQQAFSQSSAEENIWIARLESVEGTVEARQPPQTAWSPAEKDDEFEIGDAVRAQAFSRAAILLPGATTMRLDQLTTLHDC